VEHAVASPAAHLECDFRALAILFPDHWVVTSPRVGHPLSDLFPGEPAQEVVTSAIPLARPRGSALEERRHLLVNATPVPAYTLTDANGRLLSHENAPLDGADDVQRTPSTLDEVLSGGVSAGAFRLHCLRVHYRRAVSFSRAALQRSVAAYDALAGAVLRLGETRADVDTGATFPLENALYAALDNDLNAARAVSLLNVVLTNPQIAAPEKLELVLRADALLGLRLAESAAARRSLGASSAGREFQLVA
jgi:hypothetical protein